MCIRDRLHREPPDGTVRAWLEPARAARGGGAVGNTGGAERSDAEPSEFRGVLHVGAAAAGVHRWPPRGGGRDVLPVLPAGVGFPGRARGLCGEIRDSPDGVSLRHQPRSARPALEGREMAARLFLSLIHISEPTRLLSISYA